MNEPNDVGHAAPVAKKPPVSPPPPRLVSLSAKRVNLFKSLSKRD